MSSIFSDQQISSIILWLEKWDIPIKYAYMTEQWSQAWSKLEKLRTNKWQSFSDAQLLRDSIELYLQELWNPKTIAIFDFWCWTGETIKDTIWKLKKLWIGIKYHAFDLSPKIINLCKINLLTDHSDLNYNSTLIDFETSNLVNILADIREQYHNIPVLWLILWNTIGNFNSMERVLSNIIEAFRLEDRLVVGIERADLQNNRWYEKMIKSYNEEIVYNVPMSTISELWFSQKDWYHEAIFNHKTSTIESFFFIKKDFDLIINNKKISFSSWEKIRIMQSRKIDEMQFSKLFLDLDLRIANIRTNYSNSYLQALVWAKRK